MGKGDLCAQHPLTVQPSSTFLTGSTPAGRPPQPQILPGLTQDTPGYYEMMAAQFLRSQRPKSLSLYPCT